MVDVQTSLDQANKWLQNFFAQIDTYETLAVIAIGLGVLMIIAGAVLLTL